MRKPSLAFIFAVIFIDVLGIGIIIPIIPDLILELTHGEVTDRSDFIGEASRYGGWLMASYAIMQFLFAPILGALSDQYGRRWILLLSLLGFSIDYVLVALAPTILWLFIARLVSGIFGASVTTANAYIADISPPEKKAQNFGLVGAAFGLGFVFGPVIGGVLGEYGTRVPFWAAAGLTLLNFLYGLFFVPESLAKEKRRPFEWKRANPIGTLYQFKKYPNILGLLGAMFLVYIAAHATQSTWTYFTKLKFDWTPAQIGYSLGFVGLVVAFVQGYLIRLVIPSIGQKNAVYVGLSFYTVGFVLFAFASEGWMMYAFLVPYALGGLAGPSIQGLMSNEVPENAQGELQGGLTSMISVTSIVGPPVMTGLFAYFTSEAEIFFPGAPFLLGCILCILGIMFAHTSLRKI